MKRFVLVLTLLLSCVSNIFSQLITAVPDSATICQGNNVPLDVLITGDCFSPVETICTSPSNQVVIGTGSATDLSYVATPYYGFYMDSKVQMIYTAQEMSAAGLVAGEIKEIAFNVLDTGGKTFNNYTIKLGHTLKNDFVGDTTFIQGLTPVHCPGTHVTHPGWNIHPLNANFNWDGVNNVVVEVCFDNNFWHANDTVSVTAQPVPRFLIEYADLPTGSGCNLTGVSFSFLTRINRPDIRFSNCVSTPDPVVYSYTWSPSTGLSNSNIPNPIASPNSSTSYVVTVTDSTGNNYIDTVDITVNLCTFIDENNQSYEIRIYPNPTSRKITISSKKALTGSYSLINLVGQVVLEDEFNNTTELNIELNGPPGLYHLQLEADGHLITKKVVKE